MSKNKIPTIKEIEKIIKKNRRSKPGKPHFPKGRGRSSPLYENTDKLVRNIS